MKKILITNDDGFDSDGLKALVSAVKDLAEVIVVAPTLEKSASGHSLTLIRPLRFVELEHNFYKLDDGTPTDCIYLALNALFKEDEKPDLIISGINKGSNLGEDITYSGTVAGAMEGVIQGVPSIAISQVYRGGKHTLGFDGYNLAKEVTRELVKKIFDGSFPLGERKLLNINVPPVSKSESKGYKVTKSGYRIYGNDAHMHKNPRGEEHYWIGLHPLDWKNSTDEYMSDLEAINANYISITPIHLDMTSYEDIRRVQEWI
jgi:5'-nucleotidase